MQSTNIPQNSVTNFLYTRVWSREMCKQKYRLHAHVAARPNSSTFDLYLYVAVTGKKMNIIPITFFEFMLL